jgi:hypothetical protein
MWANARDGSQDRGYRLSQDIEIEHDRTIVNIIRAQTCAVNVVMITTSWVKIDVVHIGVAGNDCGYCGETIKGKWS